MDERKCLLCGNNKFALLNQRGILEKGRPMLSFNNVICKNCGLVFINPQPTSYDYEKIYQKYENSRHGCQNQYDAMQMAGDFKNNKKGEEIYNFLQEYLQNGKEVLDIGCGFGHIAYNLQNMHNCNVSAIEPSELLARMTSEKLGINVFNGQFDDYLANNSNKKFDMLIMHHVFEHFIDPIKKLNQFKNLLLPGGTIYIEIPNIASFKKPVNHFFDYMHPFSYSPKTFKELVNKNGYKIIKVNKEKKYRLQAVIAPADSGYADISDDNFWNIGNYRYIKFFIMKRRFIDLANRLI